MKYTTIATYIIATLVALPAAVAGPIDDLSGPSCTASDQTARTCVFTCLTGDTIRVSGTNMNEWYKQTFTASCGGGHASCTADHSDDCEDTAKANVASSDGLCQMEADGEGTVTCSASGGNPPSDPECLEDPVACVCPPAVCKAENDPTGPPPGGSDPQDPDIPQYPDIAECMPEIGTPGQQMTSPPRMIVPPVPDLSQFGLDCE